MYCIYIYIRIYRMPIWLDLQKTHQHFTGGHHPSGFAMCPHAPGSSKSSKIRREALRSSMESMFLVGLGTNCVW